MARYEHKTLTANSLVSQEQLDEMAADGWLLLQIVDALSETGSRWAFYFRREVAVQ